MFFETVEPPLCIAHCCVCDRDKEHKDFHRRFNWLSDQWIVCKECAAKGKHCPTCGIYQPFSAFNKNANATNRGGVKGYCRVCDGVYNRSRYKRLGKTDTTRSREYKSKYGITLEEYNMMCQEQNGLCALCGKPETKKDRAGKIKILSVDHDHSTGVVRSLLCSTCNLLLGQIETNRDRIRELFTYLDAHSTS